MRRSTLALVAATAMSTAALAQVGTDPVENKNPVTATPATPLPLAAGTPSTADATPPPADDAAPADRADAPANLTPSPGDPRDATSPPPKSRSR